MSLTFCLGVMNGTSWCIVHAETISAEPPSLGVLVVAEGVIVYKLHHAIDMSAGSVACWLAVVLM